MRGLLRRAGVRRQPRPHRLARDRHSGRRATARLQRRRGVECLTSTCRRRLGPGWRDRGRRADRGREVGVHPREGTQPSAGARRRRSPTSAISRTTRSSSTVGTSSVPTRCSNRARTAASVADGERTFTGDVNNMPSTVGGAGYPRRRQAAALPRDRLPSRQRARPGRRRRRRRLARRLRRDGAVLRRGRALHRRRRRPHRQSVRRVARRPVPDAARRRHVPHHAHRAGRGAARLPPVPRADRREQRRRTTAGPRATTAASARSTGARSRPRATRSALLRRALRTGNCEIRPESVALEVARRRHREAEPRACATSTPTACRTR